MSCIEEVKEILHDSLQLGARVEEFTASTPLLGSLPELDSMAVVTVITAIEERFGFVVEDDEISADTFSTLGNLCKFVDHKLKP